MSLDLGGTNFRVIWLRIKSGAVVSEAVQYYQVPEDVRLGPGVKLFDFLAECIHSFMDERQLKGQNLPLGFTFSFPMTQRGLDVGILVSWTKSFNCSGVVGEDAVKMLNDAIHRRGDTDVNVIAVLNDTTGKDYNFCQIKGTYFLLHHIVKVTVNLPTQQILPTYYYLEFYLAIDSFETRE